MLILDQIIGDAANIELAERLHHLSHHGVIEYLTLSQEDILRHRLRMLTDQGTECAIMLSRNEHLSNGAVLLLDEAKAIVVRMAEAKWLLVKPINTAAGIEIGYFAGNMHWKVDFDDDILRIALNGSAQNYIDRISNFIKDRKVEILSDE